MVSRETIKDETIVSGNYFLKFMCDNCFNRKEIPFQYTLNNIIIKHHGQFVEGDIEEHLKITTTLPEQFYCKNCDALHEIKTPEGIYSSYSNPNGLSLPGQEMAAQSEGSKDNILGDLEKALSSIKISLAGMPTRI